MATITATGTLTKGGSFLLETQRPEDVFSPAELTDDQKLIGQTAEEFVNKEVLPLVKELEEKKPGLLASLVKKAGELGLLCPEVPEAYGGAGLDKISVTRLLEKTSVYGSFSGALGAHSGIGPIPILYFGTKEKKKKCLPKLVTGEWIGAYALPEPQAGSDALNSLTRADLSPDGKHWILNGQKMWITNGGVAALFKVLAKGEGEKFSGFFFDCGRPGFLLGRAEH